MLGIVFPHQLFDHIPEGWKTIVLVRHDIAYGGPQTTVNNFHIARKVFFRAAEADWIERMRARQLPVRIVERGADWATDGPCECWDPVDRMLENEVRAKCPLIKILESPAFLFSRAEALELLGTHPRSSHAAFYAAVRRRTGILMDKDGQPLGGKFRFDTDNRLPVGFDVSLPNWDHEIALRSSHLVAAAHADIVKEGKSLGTWTTGKLVFPVTLEGSRKALARFVRTRLSKFGTYQDAIVENDDFLFHSLLSAPINAGLLTPSEVISEATKYTERVQLNSLEGFVAQILGWREFMRAVYLKYPATPNNRLRHRRRLTDAWYTGETGLLPLDVAIRRANEHAYLHHIERLMVVGNAMFLSEIHPDDAYKWFMELFVDSFDWVMIGNVYYMSQWASDAITTKPYISSSAYLLRMSDYKRTENWVREWDALYWTTIGRLGATLLRRNYRMAVQVAFWNRKTVAEKKQLFSNAHDVRERITRGSDQHTRRMGRTHRERHGTRHHGTRHHGTRHHGTRHHGTRHHGTRRHGHRKK
jgi:deoxyribodipyrimidine photolyase-related protein